ncbi:hypothetical protein [Cellulomonas sp. IC4_254]|uniref:hypothetical protein n=1 Tax=Cellulomonas sp. IC4_254 TaxID=2714040 RepID=UPI0014205C65|nr:hypothetical protein [Cellulomonas sp. IC4_254]
MTGTVVRAGSAAALAGGAVLLVRAARARAARGPVTGGWTGSGWLAVTVLREPAEIDTGRLPAPLAELGDRVEVRVRPAAGGKGSELAARLRDRPSPGSAPSRLVGRDPEADLRSALRRAKQVIEVGEVLAVDPAPHGRRTATPWGALLEAWTRAAPAGGVR